MKNWTVYRGLLHLLPARGQVNESTFSDAETRKAERILRRYRCVGATLCLFNENGMEKALSFGFARKGSLPARFDTIYRVASVSKLITAMGVMKLKEMGKLSLDIGVSSMLPFPLRHPGFPDTQITLRMLLSHTAGIHDGEDYNAKVGSSVPCSGLLNGDSFCTHEPGAKWEYSNFGAGIAGAALEAMGEDFETLMQKTVFAPLGVQATYYPQKTAGLPLADAYRVLPPHKGPNFDAAKRQSRPLPPVVPDPETHYALAHGNLCISGKGLCALGAALMKPGFLTAESLAEMRHIITPFGERARNLSQGLGTFVLEDASVSAHPLYGHQGMAYGAVHGLFFDPLRGRGLVLLTSGASEARRGVLADLNKAVLTEFLGDQA